MARGLFDLGFRSPDAGRAEGAQLGREGTGASRANTAANILSPPAKAPGAPPGHTPDSPRLIVGDRPASILAKIPSPAPKPRRAPPAPTPDRSRLEAKASGRKTAFVIGFAGSILLALVLLALLVVRAPKSSGQPESQSQPRPFPPAAAALGALLAMGCIVGLLAWLLTWLRKKANPIYWQIACWLLVAIGVLVRPLAVSGANPLETTVKGALLAGFVSLAVFPALMRWLNRLRPDPGLSHVALPFGLGFFLDVAQLVAKTYVPALGFLK